MCIYIDTPIYLFICIYIYTTPQAPHPDEANEEASGGLVVRAVIYLYPGKY